MTEIQQDRCARRRLVAMVAMCAGVILCTAGMAYDPEGTAREMGGMNTQQLLSYAVVTLSVGLVLMATMVLGLVLNALRANTRALEQFVALSRAGACPLRQEGRP